MASESFLSGLAGLVTGVNEGLETRRDRKTQENERAFELSKFEAQQRRASMLDALNEEVSKGRLRLQEEANQLAKDRLEHEKDQFTEIDVAVGDEVFRMTKDDARAFARMKAMEAQEREGKVPTQIGDDIFYVEPEVALDREQRGQETAAERRKSFVNSFENLFRTLLTTTGDPNLAKEQTLSALQALYPDQVSSPPPTPDTPELPAQQSTPGPRESQAFENAVSGRASQGLLPRIGGVLNEGVSRLQFLPTEQMSGRLGGSAFTSPMGDLRSRREAVERKLFFGQPIRTLEELAAARAAAGNPLPAASVNVQEDDEALARLRERITAAR